MQVIEHEPLKPYGERYAALPMRPLRVTCYLREGARLAGYDPLNLDNLLAWAVVMEATGGAGVPPEAINPYRLPVPLQVLWRSPEGLPLHACTPLLPAGESASDVMYWHKRAQSGRWTGTKSGKFNPDPIKGRWMERRVPLPNVVCREWNALCVGNPEEVARLLRSCVFIGKKRHAGLGEVEKWRVAPAGEFALTAGGALTRNMPVDALTLLPSVPKDAPSPVAWTMPQWKPSLWRPGWRAGAVA